MSSKLPRKEKTFWNFPWATYGRREIPEDFYQKCNQQKQNARLIQSPPRFSLWIQLNESVTHKQFSRTLMSLRLQTYPHWKATILAIPARRDFFALSESDPRFLWVNTPGTPNSAKLKNSALTDSRSDWMGFIQAGDVLSPAALFQMTSQIVSQQKKVPNAGILYTNEAQVNANYSEASQFLSKPKFSWFTLLHLNYIGQFWVVSQPLFQQLEGFRSDCAGHEDHDFFLRAHDKGATFHHLPGFYYYRLANNVPTKPTHTLQPIVETHLAEKNISATVCIEQKENSSYLRVKPTISTEQDISVIICFRDRSEWTLRCLEHLAKQKMADKAQVLLLNNQSQASELNKIQTRLPNLPLDTQIVDYPHPFNYAAMHNYAVKEYARGQHLFLLNNDVFLQGEHCLETLVAWSQLDWVGTVGILLKHEDESIQHAGFRALFGGHNRMVMMGHVREDDPLSYENREVFGTTFAACLFKRSLFEKIGGLRELDYPNGYGDVVFGFECLRRGYQNLYLGGVSGIHLESASRGVNFEYWEECGLEQEFPEILQQMLRNDLGYNRIPNSHITLKNYLRSRIGATLSENRWLNPIKSTLLQSRKLHAILTHR